MPEETSNNDVAPSAFESTTAEPDTMDATPPPARLPNRQAICEVLRQESEPATFAEKVSWLSSSPDVRRLRGEPAQLLASLRSRFSDRTLIRARLLSPGANSQPALTRVISAAPQFMLLQNADGRVVDVVSDVGSLWSRDPACFRWLLERQPLDRKPRRLLLASIRDTHILRALGLLAVPIVGLADMNGAQLRRLLAPQRETAPVYRPVLVAWQIDQLTNEMPAEVTRTLERIYEGVVVYESESEEDKPVVEAWIPNSEDFTQIVLANKLRDRQALKRSIIQSLRGSHRSAVGTWQKMLDERDTDLPTAFAEARALLGSKNHIPSPAEASRLAKKLREATARVTVDQLYRAAAGTNGPIFNTLCLRLANEVENYWEAEPLFAKLDQMSKLEHPNSAGTSVPSDYRDRQLNRLLKLIKGTRDATP